MASKILLKSRMKAMAVAGAVWAVKRRNCLWIDIGDHDAAVLARHSDFVRYRTATAAGVTRRRKVGVFRGVDVYVDPLLAPGQGLCQFA